MLWAVGSSADFPPLAAPYGSSIVHKLNALLKASVTGTSKAVSDTSSEARTVIDTTCPPMSVAWAGEHGVGVHALADVRGRRGQVAE